MFSSNEILPNLFSDNDVDRYQVRKDDLQLLMSSDKRLTTINNCFLLNKMLMDPNNFNVDEEIEARPIDEETPPLFQILHNSLTDDDIATQNIARTLITEHINKYLGNRIQLLSNISADMKQLTSPDDLEILWQIISIDVIRPSTFTFVECLTKSIYELKDDLKLTVNASQILLNILSYFLENQDKITVRLLQIYIKEHIFSLLPTIKNDTEQLHSFIIDHFDHEFSTFNYEFSYKRWNEMCHAIATSQCTSIDLSRCRFGRITIKKLQLLVTALLSAPNLIELNLKCSLTDMSDEHWQVLLPLFSKTSKFKKINLSENKLLFLPIKNWLALMNSLIKSNIKSIDFSCNANTGEGSDDENYSNDNGSITEDVIQFEKEKWATFLALLSQLDFIDLSHSQFSMIDLPQLESLFALFSNPNCKIKSLRIGNNALEGDVFNLFCNMLINTSIESVDIEGRSAELAHNLSKDEMLLLCNNLKKITKIKKINLSHILNWRDDEEKKALLDALRNIPVSSIIIEDIFLYYSDPDDEYWENLCIALAESRTLTDVDLTPKKLGSYRVNEMSDHQWDSFCKALSTAKFIRIGLPCIDLAQLNPKRCEALEKALKINPYLLTIERIEKLPNFTTINTLLERNRTLKIIEHCPILEKLLTKLVADEELLTNDAENYQVNDEELETFVQSALNELTHWQEFAPKKIAQEVCERLQAYLVRFLTALVRYKNNITIRGSLAYFPYNTPTLKALRCHYLQADYIEAMNLFEATTETALLTAIHNGITTDDKQAAFDVNGQAYLDALVYHALGVDIHPMATTGFCNAVRVATWQYFLLRTLTEKLTAPNRISEDNVAAASLSNTATSKKRTYEIISNDNHADDTHEDMQTETAPENKKRTYATFFSAESTAPNVKMAHTDFSEHSQFLIRKIQQIFAEISHPILGFVDAEKEQNNLDKLWLEIQSLLEQANNNLELLDENLAQGFRYCQQLRARLGLEQEFSAKYNTTKELSVTKSIPLFLAAMPLCIDHQHNLQLYSSSHTQQVDHFLQKIAGVITPKETALTFTERTALLQYIILKNWLQSTKDYKTEQTLLNSYSHVITRPFDFMEIENTQQELMNLWHTEYQNMLALATTVENNPWYPLLQCCEQMSQHIQPFQHSQSFICSYEQEEKFIQEFEASDGLPITELFPAFLKALPLCLDENYIFQFYSENTKKKFDCFLRKSTGIASRGMASGNDLTAEERIAILQYLTLKHAQLKLLGNNSIITFFNWQIPEINEPLSLNDSKVKKKQKFQKIAALWEKEYDSMLKMNPDWDILLDCIKANMPPQNEIPDQPIPMDETPAENHSSNSSGLRRTSR